MKALRLTLTPHAGVLIDSPTIAYGGGSGRNFPSRTLKQCTVRRMTALAAQNGVW